jgi:hypothetical protein
MAADCVTWIRCSDAADQGHPDTPPALSGDLAPKTAERLVAHTCGIIAVALGSGTTADHHHLVDEVLSPPVAAGFIDVAGFHRAFRREFGRTPGQMRTAAYQGPKEAPNLRASPRG